MTDPSAPGPEARPIPTNRKEAIALLRKVEYDLATLSPDEIGAIRAAFHLGTPGVSGGGGP
jgi:hypothetical protein